MRILVFSKIVREVENLRDFEWTKFIEDRDLSFAPRIWSPDDEGALEAALDLKEAYVSRGREVTVEAVLLREDETSVNDFTRQLYAIGFDVVTVLNTQAAFSAEEGCEPTEQDLAEVSDIDIARQSTEITDTAEIFKNYVATISADLLICGHSALPRDLGMTAGGLAAALNLPITAAVEEFEFQDSTPENAQAESSADSQAELIVYRRNAAYREGVMVSLPHVLTLQDYRPHLRVATLMEKMRAKKKSAKEISTTRSLQAAKKLGGYRHEAHLRDGKLCPFADQSEAAQALIEVRLKELIETAKPSGEEDSTTCDERWSENFFETAERFSYQPYFVELKPGLVDLSAFATAITDLPNSDNCCFFLPPQENAGSMAGYLARRTSGLAVTQVTQISLGEAITIERMAYAHNLYESMTIEAGAGPYFIVLEQEFDTNLPEIANRLFEVESYFKSDLSGARLLSQTALPTMTDNKPVVVVAGRGVSAENIGRLRELCAAQDWAFTATRAVVYQGLAGKEEMVGISGLTLAPQLALLIGVSGATPLMWGIKDAKTLISVNENPEALVTRQADIALIGDSAIFIDALSEAL